MERKKIPLRAKTRSHILMHEQETRREHHHRNMGLTALKDVDPDSRRHDHFSDVDEIVSSQHLLVLKTADDFPINSFVRNAVFLLQLSLECYQHWFSSAFSNAKIFLRSYLDAYYGNNLFVWFQYPALGSARFWLALFILLFHGWYNFKIVLVRTHGA